MEAPSAGPGSSGTCAGRSGVSPGSPSGGATLRPGRLPDEALRFGAISLVGAIEQLMIEWQEGELGLSVDQIIDYLVQMLLLFGRVAGIGQ